MERVLSRIADPKNRERALDKLDFEMQNVDLVRDGRRMLL
jgi:hypothetical protein